MKQLKRIAGVIASILIFVEIINGLNYIYASASDSRWERVLWNEFYESKGKIDNLILGSSHVYYGINPVLLDEKNGQYNFNLATTGQLMNGTYYLLREADKTNNLSHVYIELYYRLNTVEISSGEEPITTELYRNWANTDYMEFSLNKLSYMRSIADVEKYPDILFPFVRYRSMLDDWEYIKSTVDMKKSDDYMKHDRYREKGYYDARRTFEEKEKICEQERILEEKPMSQLSEKYLRKALTYCQKKKIPVTLFVAPIYELQLVSTKNYDNYVNHVREIAEEYNVDFYDFNLAKEEYLPIQDAQYFHNIDHLRVEGATMFTEFFSKVMSADASENEKYFYDSYEEKLQNSKPEVYGLYYRVMEPTENNAEPVKKVWIASNRETEFEYRIVVSPTDKDPYMEQDFSDNKEFTVNANEYGICAIVYRLKDMPESVRTLEIGY